MEIFENLIGMAVLLLLLACLLLVPALTIWNLITFVHCLTGRAERRWERWLECGALAVGYGYFRLYLELAEVRRADWWEELVNYQQHSILALDAIPSVAALAGLAFAGYLVLRFVPPERQPPLVCVLALAAAYCGVGLCVLWCVQTAWDPFLMLYPANCALVLLKAVYRTVRRKSALWTSGEQPVRCEPLAALLARGMRLPWVALLAVLPMLGVLAGVLTLFGQTPDALIRAWTETAYWTFSQKTPPPNVFMDTHYLCTAAARGHPKLVKPLRVGRRHGHTVLVNRQLCVANAFEGLLEEKTPRLHRAVRRFYDRTGYPIARHIRSPWAADAVYCLMKPLEWLFLLVLYAADPRPEDRIAVQYPHTAPPGAEGRRV